MSSKKNNPENKAAVQPTNSQGFSFLELDNFLSQENFQKDNNLNNNTFNKPSTKKKLSQEKEKNKTKEKDKQKLRIKPNASKAREQTNEDLMYIEKDDNIQENQNKEKIKDEIKDINNINLTKEKSNLNNINNKKSEQKEKIDKRIVKLNLDKEKAEEKSKNKKEEKFIKNNENLGNKENSNKKLENYDIESIINDIKEKDPKAYVPIVLPFGKEEQKKSLKEELNNENNMFIFQFPRQIPIKDLNNQTKIKEEENVNEEPNYDENGFLISQEFKNSFNEIKENTVIGKLVIMKSGKIKIKMGDIYFDINEGSLTKFAQYSAVVTGNDDNQAYILGQPLNKKLIVTPEFD